MRSGAPAVRRMVLAALALLFVASPALAQQRPLVTEDPETIGAGRVLVEGGLDYQHRITYPASGLTGNLWRVAAFGVSFGISSIAELQVDGGLRNRLTVTERVAAPLSDQLDFVGDTTGDIEDIVVATKVRFLSETPGRPGLAVRFATRLPNAGNESGLGLDTTDFLATLLIGKTVQSVRVVGNIGLGILGSPTRGDSQNDVLLYGLSVARAFTDRAEFVGEINGRAHTADGEPPIGTESRSMMRFGGRYTMGAGRVDGGVLIGMTTRDPSIGFTVGYTHVFSAFTVP
jgi:hypothetical protein